MEHTDIHKYKEKITKYGDGRFIELIEDSEYPTVRIAGFDPSVFWEIISFIKTNLSNDLIIIVDEKIEYSHHTFHNVIDLSNCRFNLGLSIKNSLFYSSVTFKGAVFDKIANFNDTRFKEKIRFHNSIFKIPGEFHNTKFEKLVDFFNAEFETVQQFYKTDFLDVTIFSKVKFNDQVQFLYNKVTSQTIISFQNAIFKQSVDISRSNFWGRIQFWGIEIDKIDPNRTSLYEIEDDKKKGRIDVLRKIRESYRRIKQELRKEDNNIDAQRFHQYEMRLYEKEAMLNNRLEDRLLLFFNRFSNNFGSSWLKGVFFTFLVALIFYSAFLLLISNSLAFDPSMDSIGKTVKFYFQFLNITNWDYKPFNLDYNWAYVALFIGRIFVGYGYFQTIQAFRKHGKN